MQSKNRYDHRLAYKKSSAPAHKDELQTYLDAPTEECEQGVAKDVYSMNEASHSRRLHARRRERCNGRLLVLFARICIYGAPAVTHMQDIAKLLHDDPLALV